ncbi:MAG TPA: response regulator transcription factor [Gammaproteobacteria bacterium]|nr:response regulator transcription factor [Gammaproteobacteria bacterium]
MKTPAGATPPAPDNNEANPMSMESLESPLTKPGTGSEIERLFVIAGQGTHVNGLVQLIDALPGHEEITWVGPDADCLSRFGRNPARLCLMEQAVVERALNDTSPEALFAPYREIEPDVRFLVFGHDMDDVFVRSMVRAGVHGLIDDSLDPASLRHALDEVRAGGYWIGRRTLENFIHGAIEMQEIIEQGIRDRIDAIQDHLTRRESDVLQHVLEGKSTKEIARELHLSEQSVKLYLGRLFRKFEVTNRSQLILMAFQRVCPVNNMIQLFRRTLDRRRIELGQPPLIPDPLDKPDAP